MYSAFKKSRLANNIVLAVLALVEVVDKFGIEYAFADVIPLSMISIISSKLDTALVCAVVLVINISETLFFKNSNACNVASF